MEDSKDKLMVDDLFTETPTSEGWLLDHGFVELQSARGTWEYTGALDKKLPFLEHVIIRVLKVAMGWMAVLHYGDHSEEASDPDFLSAPRLTSYEALEVVVERLRALAEDYEKKRHQEKLQTMLKDLFPEQLRPYPEDENWLFMHGFTRWLEIGNVWVRDMLPKAYVRVSRQMTGNWLAEWVDVTSGLRHDTLSKGAICASPEKALLSMLDGCLKLPAFAAVGRSQETEEI